jgi:prepilin-type N-terminal cleavage/methylation domain-containing protein
MKAKLKIKKACPAKLERSEMRSGGFTLLELMVVITIATIMITTLVVQQSKWSDRLTVNTQAYELALMIRQAQIFSLGVRENLGSTGDKFNIGYGITATTSPTTQYIFFADKNANLKYDNGEEIEIKTFTKGVLIEKFCGIRGGVEDCTSPLDKISISFFRPEPKANIRFLNGGGNTAPGFGPPATIYLKSVGNKQYKITIEANGQVATTQI